MSPRTPFLATACAVLMTCGGCHAYTAPIGAPTPGAVVRVRFDPARDLAIDQDGAHVASYGVSTIDGRIASVHGDTVDVRDLTITYRNFTWMRCGHCTVRVVRAQATALEERYIAREPTVVVLLVVGFVISLYVALAHMKD